MATENSIMLTERTDELLNRGRSQGFISTEEVADLMQEGDLSAAEVEEFYATLEEEEITVVEGETAEVEAPAPAVTQVSEVPAVQIAHAVATGDSIRIPVHMVEKVNKFHRTHRRMIQVLGREPSDEEIAGELKMPVEEILRLQEISQRSISLETPVGDDDSSELGDFLEDAASATPTDAVSESLLKLHLREALDELPERERQIIELRFGMKDDRPRTLEEVGREFDITRERVRQIQMKTLNLLREQRRTQNLREYLR